MHARLPGGQELLVHPDAGLLAEVTAGRLVAALVDAIALRGTASVVLTGGRVGTDVLRRLARSPAREAVEWAQVDVWWGDERFVPSADADRNERQAREALLDGLRLDPSRVHPMGSTDTHETPEDAADAYAAELAASPGAGPTNGPSGGIAVPAFDVVLLGTGEEGHTGSIFPGAPAAHEHARSVVGVRGCPKPPPQRVTLTLPAFAAARQAWFVVAGVDKAAAVAAVVAGAGPLQVPAAGVRARERTLWLVDRAAASRLLS